MNRPLTEEQLARPPWPDLWSVLRADHRRLLALFDQFEASHDLSTKSRLAQVAFVELKRHSTVEDRVAEPRLRGALGDDPGLAASREEHHFMGLLVDELVALNPWEPEFDPKFLVLGQNVRRHVEKEERDLFARAAASGAEPADPETLEEIRRARDAFARPARGRPSLAR